ncbi:MAG: metallophosphoesterase family protein [Bradymonadia bacterium]
MRIAVISDLHLGIDEITDEFGHDDAEFLKFLDFLEADHEQIVLLGDIYETLTPPWPGAWSEALEAVQSRHQALTDRFRGPKYSYIHGNHDLVAARLLGAPGELWLEVDGTRILFTHGHMHDWLIRRARCISEIGVWFGGLLRRIGLGAVYRMLEQMEHRLHSSVANADPSQNSFQRWATHMARHRGADIIVTGHTHTGGCAEHGRQLFMNSGSCSLGHTSFLSLDTRSGQFGFHSGW